LGAPTFRPNNWGSQSEAAEAAHQIEAKIVYLPKAALAIGSSRWTSHMNPDLFYAFTIAFVGAALFLFVDKYERKGPVARLLKFLVLFVGGVAILHKLQPLFGIELF
jgi:hypothetical protein